MSKSRPSGPLSPQIRIQATQWLLRFSEGEIDAAAREEFNHWLRSSPEHVRAYLRVAAFWQEAEHLDGKQGSRDIAALVAHANSEANVFPLAFGPRNDDTPASHASTSVERSRRRSFLRSPFVAIAATVIALVGALVTYQQVTSGIYRTGIGEQRTVNLPDGSTLILNADSRARVRYTDAQRMIDLDVGQALFKVARNPERPFIVRSGGTSVRAVGTQFDVYRKTTEVTVTVVEGKVAVMSEQKRGATAKDAGGIGPFVASPGSAEHEQSVTATLVAPESVFLTAGEQVTIPKIAVERGQPAVSGAAAVPQVRPVKVEAATAWTEGLLVFEGAPLADVVREFNRQNSKPLVIKSDPQLLELKISGSFPANGSERITRFLQERFAVVVHESADEITLSRR